MLPAELLMLLTFASPCYFNPLTLLACYGPLVIENLVPGYSWQLALALSGVVATLGYALLSHRFENLVNPPVTPPTPATLPRVLVSHSGHCKSCETTGHPVIGDAICCICDRKRRTVFRCRNIADNVCLGCVVQWTIMNPNGANPWPCCRPLSDSESSE